MLARQRCGVDVSERLDRALRALKAQPADRRLDQLEPAVWRRVERAEGRTAIGAGAAFSVRFAGVVGSLCLGLAAGGLSAASAKVADNEISVFSVGPQLAPSTLLEGLG